MVCNICVLYFSNWSNSVDLSDWLHITSKHNYYSPSQIVVKIVWLKTVNEVFLSDSCCPFCKVQIGLIVVKTCKSSGTLYSSCHWGYYFSHRWLVTSMQIIQIAAKLVWLIALHLCPLAAIEDSLTNSCPFDVFISSPLQKLQTSQIVVRTSLASVLTCTHLCKIAPFACPNITGDNCYHYYSHSIWQFPITPLIFFHISHSLLPLKFSQG